MGSWVRRLGRGAHLIARVRPKTGLGIAGELGFRFAKQAGRRLCPVADEVRSVFPDLDPASVEQVRREISALEFRNASLQRLLLRKGLDILPPLLRVRAEPLLDLLESNTPAIVVSWHMGPWLASSMAFEQLGVPVLFVVDRARERRTGPLEYFKLDGELPARFLKRALHRLTEGGVVGMAVDAPLGTLSPVSFLGCEIELPRGSAVLARMSGARLVPVAHRWIGRTGAIEVVFHEPIPEPMAPRTDPDAYEEALLTATHRWFEDYLRTNPGNIRLNQLHEFSATIAE